MQPIAAQSVAWSVYLSDGVLDTTVSYAKTAKPIEMPFGTGNCGERGDQATTTRLGSGSLSERTIFGRVNDAALTSIRPAIAHPRCWP